MNHWTHYTTIMLHQPPQSFTTQHFYLHYTFLVLTDFHQTYLYLILQIELVWLVLVWLVGLKTWKPPETKICEKLFTSIFKFTFVNTLASVLASGHHKSWWRLCSKHEPTPTGRFYREIYMHTTTKTTSDGIKLHLYYKVFKIFKIKIQALTICVFNCMYAYYVHGEAHTYNQEASWCNFMPYDVPNTFKGNDSDMDKRKYWNIVQVIKYNKSILKHVL